MREWVFEGVGYPTRREMCAARRRRYVELLETGMNFTQAALAVGVSKRTGKVWRNGRTRSTGRNEKPVVDWYRSTVDKPRRINARYLSQDERMSIADWRRAGTGVHEDRAQTGPAGLDRQPRTAPQCEPRDRRIRAVPGPGR